MHDARAFRFERWMLGILILLFAFVPQAFLQTDPETQQQLQDKKNEVEKLNTQISDYEKKIEEKVKEKLSLNQQLDILQNRIAKTDLEMKETETNIDAVNLRLVDLEKQTVTVENRLEREREMMVHVLQNIQSKDQTLPTELYFSSKNFSEVFDVIQRLSQVNRDLKESVDSAKSTKKQLLSIRDQEKQSKDDLEKLHNELQKDKWQYDTQQQAKQSLLASTKQSEARFRDLLMALKQEQDSVQQQIQSLQSKLEKQIGESDRIGTGSSILSWPVSPNIKGITAYYHDASYPFRYLFEHSGLDVAAPIGTAVKSAAPGYVAWTRKNGKQYGNYVMIIHSNGIATLYAHLSRIDVLPDQFVARGERIGAVGMTGLTTGPHLHFEVRKNGLPTDPMNYLEQN